VKERILQLLDEYISQSEEEGCETSLEDFGRYVEVVCGELGE
jgi:hypothetical protein